jgi:hypothetical protein
MAVLAGLLSTNLSYHFGDANQVESLPVLARILDPSYLLRDPFVNASTRLSAHTVSLLLVAPWTRFARLEVVAYWFTALASMAMSLVAGLAARDLSGSELAGLVAPVLMACAHTFALGWTSAFRITTLHTSTVVFPLILLAVWQGLRRRPLASALAAGLAACIHPTMGLTVGLALLASQVAVALWQALTGREALRSLPWLRWIAAGTLVCAGLLPHLASFLGGSRIDPVTYVQLLARFRTPHHYLASTYAPGDWWRAALFLFGMGLTVRCLRRAAPSVAPWRAMLSLVIVVATVSGIGWLAVEVGHSRLWTLIQAWRLPALVQMLGLLLVGAQVARLWEHRWLDGSLLLMAALWPETLALAELALAAQSAVERRIGLTANWQRLLLGLALAGWWLARSPNLDLAILLPTLALAAALLGRWPLRLAGPAVALGATALIALSLVAPLTPVPAGLSDRLTRIARPELAIQPERTDLARVAAWARAHTAPESLFLAPPLWGQFRLLAERALVVDFKAVPNGEADLLAWQQRLFDCYGQPIATGFAAAGEMDANYRHLSAQHLSQLAERYGLDYAILYREAAVGEAAVGEAAVGFPVLYKYGDMRVVALR